MDRDRLPPGPPPPPGGYPPHAHPPHPQQDPTFYRPYAPAPAAMGEQPHQDAPTAPTHTGHRHSTSDLPAPGVIPPPPPPASHPHPHPSSIPYHQYPIPMQQQQPPLPPPPAAAAPPQQEQPSLPYPHPHPPVESISGQIGTVTPSPSVPLALPGDPDRLAKPLCFLRQQLEVFAATAQDINERKTGPKPPLGSVGLRCIHCAHVVPKTRGAVVYPRSLSLMHQAVRNFQRHHFWSCPNMPHEKKEVMNSFKPGKEHQSKRNSNEYWLKSAMALGLIDVHPVDAPPSPPPPAEEGNAAPGGKKRKRTSISKMKKERGNAAPHIRFGSSSNGAPVPHAIPSQAHAPPTPHAAGADAATEAAAYAAADAAAAAAAAHAATGTTDAVPPLPGTAVAAGDSTTPPAAAPSSPVAAPAPAPAPPGKKPGHDIDAAEVLYGLAKKGDTPNGTPV